jgi:uncharacterized membrane protein YkgB
MGVESSSDLGLTLEGLGAKVMRYGLVIVLLWVGALKFTAYEAEAVQGLIANSPLMSWMFSLMSVRGAAALIGVIEITLALMIAVRPIAPLISAVGSIGAIIMFLTTLTFLLTTPGVWQPGYGFPYLSPSVGQFLAKDLLPLGIRYLDGRAKRCSHRAVAK